MTARIGADSISSPAVSVALLLFGCGLGMNVLAASSPVVIPVENVRGVHNREVSAKPYPITAVDHVLVDTSGGLGESIDLTGKDLKIAAPVLSLTPRAVSLMDRIFATGETQGAPAVSGANSAVDGENTEQSESHDDSVVTQSLRQQSSEEAEISGPGLQQRMYRKDI